MASKRSLSLLALLLGIAACVTTALTVPPRAPRPGEGDVALYRAIVDRVRHGEPYYPAAHAELLARHYGLRSPLNWRTPTLTWLAAHTPAKALLVAVSIITLSLAIRQTKQQGGLPLALFAAVVLPSALLSPLIGDTYLFSELWAAVLIFLSILLHPRWPVLAALPALAALFVRELAAIYVVLLLIQSLQSRKTLILLTSGLLAYGAFYLWHRHQVFAQVVPTDPAYPSGYLTLQGLRFLLATARQSIYLLALPLVVTGVYLPVAIYGVVRAGGLIARTSLAYLVLFAIAGKPFNDYWGLLIAPVLAYGVVLAASPLLSRGLGLRRTHAEARETVPSPG